MNKQPLVIILLLLLLVLIIPTCKEEPDPIIPDNDARLILCLHEIGKGTLENIKEHYKIREAIQESNDAPQYYWLPKNAKDVKFNLHIGVKAYADLNKELPYVWDIAKVDGKVKVINEGPLIADKVLSWINLKQQEEPSFKSISINEDIIDIDFEEYPEELLGFKETPEELDDLYKSSLPNIRDLPGFKPIPKSEWDKWCDAFPLERKAQFIFHITKQTIGSCVGQSGVNGLEYPQALWFGVRDPTYLSPIFLYKPISRNANSGAYIPDCMNRIVSIGCIPSVNSPDVNLWKVAHYDTNHYSVNLPVNSEATAINFRAEAYYVDDDESWFAVTMRDNLCVHYGRKGHAISGFAVVRNGNRYLAAYQNSWGEWGVIPEKSVGLDGQLYSGIVYVLVVPEHKEVYYN